MQPETDLPPWHSALTRQIFAADSIRNLLLRAPNEDVLAELWKLISIELHGKRLDPDTKTLRIWKECVGQRTVQMMEANPHNASHVYSRMFTFFDGRARDALYAELTRIVKDVPYQQNQTHEKES